VVHEGHSSIGPSSSVILAAKQWIRRKNDYKDLATNQVNLVAKTGNASGKTGYTGGNFFRVAK
jgi:hypothetical protein